MANQSRAPRAGRASPEPERGGPLYRQVAERIESLIEGGTLRVGERIPSIRELKRQLGVSITTVSEAYRRLEDAGLIEARARSGYFVRRRVRLVPPEPRRTESTATAAEPCVADAVLLMQRSTGLLPCACAHACTELLPMDRLHRSLSRALRHESRHGIEYCDVVGYEPLRVQIARRLMAAGCSLTPDDIVITSGCQEALLVSLQAVTSPGDIVVVETPTYYGLLQALEGLGLRALEVATDPRTGVCLDALGRLLEREDVAACVFIPSFGNPLGHCMPEENRRELVALLSRFDTPLIEDDIFGELSFDGSRPRAVKAFDESGLVLHCSSFSKTLAPGYRVGWVAPGRYRDAVVRMKFCASITTSAPPQLAIADYLAAGGYSRHLRRLRATLEQMVARYCTAIAEHFPQGTRVSRPRGGFTLWVEMSPSVDSLRLQVEAERLGIGLAPGPLFSTIGGYRHCMRLSCSAIWSERVNEALHVLGQLVQRMS